MSFKNYPKIAVLSLAAMFTAMSHADIDDEYTAEDFPTCYPTSSNIAEIMENEYHLPNERPASYVDGEGVKNVIEKGYRIFEGEKYMLAATKDFAATSTREAVTCIISVRTLAGSKDPDAVKLWNAVHAPQTQP